ncbi:MAG TPA: phage portal protein [Caproicibacter sp.]|nr:phage portal protein [Caproicibacter sp.]
MLQMTVEQLKGYNAGNISELLGLVQPILDHRLDLYQRYARKFNENETMHGSLDENKQGKAIVPFEFYIVNMVQGYLGGKAPMYSISTPTDYALKQAGKSATDNEKQQYIQEYAEALEYIRNYNDDAATFIELIHDYLTMAAAYLYIYENKNNEVVYTRFDAKQTVGIYDYSTPANLIGLVRHWKEKDVNNADIDVVEVITDEARTVYRNNVQDGEPEELKWGDVPGVAFDNPDGIAVFEPALSPIATYEQITNNIRNMTQYNDDAKLMMTGYTAENPVTIADPNDSSKVILNPARAAEEAAYRKAQTIFVGPDGNVQWLLKEVSYDGLESVLSNQHDLITMLTGVPNMTDDAFSNADNASALGYKLYALDQYSATADRVFRKGLLRLWEVVTNRLNLKGAQFDFRNIVITLQRNIPTDKDKSLNRALTAYNGQLISQQTALAESQLDVDPQEEMERQRNEQDADYQESLKRAKENPQNNLENHANDGTGNGAEPNEDGKEGKNDDD